MCGRYSLALRPGQVRQMLQDDDMPVYDAPEDYDGGDDGNEGEGGPPLAGYPRQSYNFAPGYHGIVYRADVPDWGAGPAKGRKQRRRGDADAEAEAEEDEDEDPADHDQADDDHAGEDKGEVHYRLQAMKWGLIPFWTKRSPGYGSMMKTINCRDDSLAQSGGMWSSMKARKRCVVVAQGFYEWLKKDGGRDKIPHFVKRKDGKLMCFAGLWDVVQYESEDEKNYTYTIITTDSNKQLNFLHDRMPAILKNGSEDLRTWLDPKRHVWSKELQSLLKPYDGELEVYPVSKEVGKVGNNSPNFIIPVDSKENKSNIANFFAKGAGATAKKQGSKGSLQEQIVKEEEVEKHRQPEVELDEKEGFIANEGDEEQVVVNHPATRSSVKREAEDSTPDEKQESPKRRKMAPISSTTSTTTKSSSPSKTASAGPRPKISATSNGTKSPSTTKQKEAGTQKITKFFANSS